MSYEARTSGDAKSKINSDSGCNSNTPETGLASSDYTTITPNTKASWNYSFHNVSQTWAKSMGSGAKMVIIDTGCSSSQENLGSTFNQGSSSGRTVEKLVTLPRNTFLGIPTGPIETSNDACGHGTSMQGAAVAPRGTDGNTVGIAYNANLISIRAAQDVFLNESRESKGVADAFTLAGNKADVKVISMSMGNIISSGQIADGVRYAYGKGKLIFCAGGTSFGWTAGYFVVVMEKASGGRKPLSLAMSGDTPSTVGGSSVATASTAAMATLIFSKYSSLSRDKVFNRMKQNTNYYPSRNGNFGWGRVNIDAALN